MGIEIELSAPSFLVAVPQMGDPNFSRAVVLVLDHDVGGTMGLVLNRASDFTVGELCESQGMAMDSRSERVAPVFVGGPVQQDRAFILHSSQPDGPQGEPVMGNLELSWSMESLRSFATSPPSFMRLYLGYSGWGPGQLGDELEAGAWLLAPAEPDLIAMAARHSGDLWETVMARLGIDPLRLIHSGMIH